MPRKTSTDSIFSIDISRTSIPPDGEAVPPNEAVPPTTTGALFEN